MFARFLSTLDATRNSHGSLARNLVIAIASELGRFPRLNGSEGKDHFNEAPVILYTPRTATGEGATYGQTGRKMEALPVSPRTGKPAAGGTTIQLDDIGATLLQMAGVAPSLYGYGGRILDFLL
jgi:hypothetical protein